MAKAWHLSASRAGAHACVRRARETTIEPFLYLRIRRQIELPHIPPGEDTCNIQVGHCEGLPREVNLQRQHVIQNAQRQACLAGARRAPHATHRE